MSAAEPLEDTTQQRPERAVLLRKFEADLSVGDGRTVDMRIVPFGERATVADGLGGKPRGVPYEEEWMPGVFDAQLNAAHRVLLNFAHQPGLQGVIGRGLELHAAEDGYHGSFKVLAGPDGDKALELVREGVLTGASVEAYPKKSTRAAGGVVQRVKAHLDSVALCRVGAFAGAVVTALREEEVFVDEDLLPNDMDHEIVERLQRLGIQLPDSLTRNQTASEGAPRTDTPAPTGTSEDGTRPEPSNHESGGTPQ